MLPMSLNCLRPVSCVPNVTSVSELSSSCLLCKRQDDDNSETLVTLGTQETGRRQFRHTGNIGYTRDRTKTIQRHYRPVSCVPNVTSVSELSSFCLLCTQCYQCLWIVIVLSLVYPMLPVSLNCLRSVSCVPNVTSVSELSSSCLLCTQWVHKRQDEDNSETLVTLGTQETARWQFRDTGNIGYTRDRTKTIQRHW
jgi:hypothetical protein